MKIVINSIKYGNIKEWAKQLPRQFEKEGEIVYKARNTLKKMNLNGGAFVVKKYSVPIMINRIAYTFFRKSKARRAYENAMYLTQMGIGTPSPVCYIEIKEWGIFKQGYFACENNDTPNIMREFVYTAGGGEEILKQFAAFTKTMHDKKILHLDYSPGNIIYSIDKEGKSEFFLLDLNRMKFNKELSRKERLYNFRRMFICKTSTEIVVREYARLCGWNQDDAVEEALRYNAQFWEKKEKKNKLKKRLKKHRDR